VARGVGDDELALLAGEEAVRDVDRDPLLAFGDQAVEQQREVEIPLLGAEAQRVALERREVVLEDQLGLPQQAADERALAVVDAAAGDEAQEALVALLSQVGLDVVDRDGGRDAQKYPSCFLRSIEPLWSWSIRRPCRSEVRARNISRMISGSVSASLSTAPLSG
jgi:hypothetical protein